MSFGVPVRNGLAVALKASTTLSSGAGGSRPAMSLNFLSGYLDSRITFSRGSQATLTDSTGRITYAPNNLLLYSQTFDNVIWAKTNATLTSGVADPVGGTSAFTLTASGGALTLQQAPTVTSGVALSASIWIKRRTGTGAVSMRCGDATAIPITVTSSWARVSVTATPTSTAGRFAIILSTVGDEVDIYGAQLEAVTYQTTPSTYTATTASAYYGPRFDYDPVTLAPKGLLIEGQRTNLLTYSEQLDGAAWTKGNTTVSVNAATSPSGAVNADKLVEDTANSTHNVIITAPPPSGVAVAFSFYAKAAGRSRLRFGGGGFSGQGFTAIFDVSNGTMTSNTGGNGSITPVGGGWYRCVVAFTTANAVQFSLGLADNTNATTYTGDGTSGAYIWGAQLEAGAFATSYIPTVASTVTRAADNALMTGTNFSSWYNQSEGAVLFEGGRFDDTPNFAAGWGISNGTASNEMYVTRASATPRAYTRTSGGADGDLNGVQTWPLNTSAKVAFAFKVDDMALVFNGGAAITDTSAAVPPVTQLQVGRRAVAGPTTYWNGHIRTITYYNTRLPNSQLQRLTQ